MRIRRRGVPLPNGQREIAGHPAIEAVTESGRKMEITVCSDCGGLRTILYLAGDRWLCTQCRAEGSSKPTPIPLSRPGR